MNSEHIALVQSTWRKIDPISQTAAELFYGRLFELDPSLKSLFKIPINEQGRKLMQMIGIVVKGLDHLEALVPAVQDLGKRHVGYGVKDHHYDTVGAALLWTLEQGLGPDYTPEVQEAWSETYGVLADVMRGAVAEAA